MIGSVEFFNNVKGWGIIKTDDDESAFIHHSEITDSKFFPFGKPVKFKTLKTGQRVSFILSKVDGKLPAATKLQLIGK